MMPDNTLLWFGKFWIFTFSEVFAVYLCHKFSQKTSVSIIDSNPSFRGGRTMQNASHSQLNQEAAWFAWGKITALRESEMVWPDDWTAAKYPFLKYEEMIVDNCSMQLVKNPAQFDVMVAPNLYGTIISHIAAGITGGVGMTPGACIGSNYALFSQGMPHTGLNIAGKNIANPTSILISSVMMLRYLGLPRFADQISFALKEVLEEKKVRTKDIGGHHSTSDFTKAIIHRLWFAMFITSMA